MLALEISSMKNFMNHLLSADTFDGFLLEEASISAANTYVIDGHMNVDFFPPQERDKEHVPYDFRPWREMRELCFHLIKGKYAPLHFKFVLLLKPELAGRLLRDNADDLPHVKALVLNIRYDGGKAVLTTGTSFNTFVMSRETDAVWDGAICKYLNDKGIGYEKL